eukprot:1137869-Pelagomonas_calceolata.AAC.6
MFDLSTPCGIPGLKDRKPNRTLTALKKEPATWGNVSSEKWGAGAKLAASLFHKAIDWLGPSGQDARVRGGKESLNSLACTHLPSGILTRKLLFSLGLHHPPTCQGEHSRWTKLSTARFSKAPVGLKSSMRMTKLKAPMRISTRMRTTRFAELNKFVVGGLGSLWRQPKNPH